MSVTTKISCEMLSTNITMESENEDLHIFICLVYKFDEHIRKLWSLTDITRPIMLLNTPYSRRGQAKQKARLGRQVRATIRKT